MDDKFWHAAHVTMPTAWLMAALPDPTYAVVLAAGVVVGVMILSLRNLVGRADDFLAGEVRIWRAVVSAVVKYLILLAFRAAAMVAQIAADIASRIAARRPEPPPQGPRNLPTPALSPRLVPVPAAASA
jgi:hypothetical protein